MSLSSASHPSALSSGIILAPFVERFLQGRRVALLGDATSNLASELVTRGARLVHVYDPDAARVAQAIAQGLPRSVTAAPFTDGDLGVRDHAFDLTLVPNLAFFLNPYALLARVRQMTTALGLAVVSLRCEDAARLQLGYYELYDAASLQFSSVKMVGQIPFDGFALVDFGAEDPEVTVDASFADAASREPLSYVVVASETPVAIDGYTIVQLPHEGPTESAPTIAAGSLAPSPASFDALRLELTQVRARLEATLIELESAREGRTAAEAQSYEARRRVADLEQELSVLQGMRNELALSLERARLDVAQAGERASTQLEAFRAAERASSDARKVGEKLGNDGRAAADRALLEARRAAEEAEESVRAAVARAEHLEGIARDLADRGVRLEQELSSTVATATRLKGELNIAAERIAALETSLASETLRADRAEAELKRTSERLDKSERTESDIRRSAERAAIDARRALERAEAEARAASERAADRIDQLTRQIAELKAVPRGVALDDHERLRAQTAALLTELEDLRTQADRADELEDEVARLREVAKDLTRLRDLERELARVAPLEKTAARVAPLEREVAKLRELEKEVARIPQLEKTAARVPQLEAEVARLSGLERELETAQDSNATEVVNAEKALRERAQKIAVLEREVERRGAIVRELLGELEAARDAAPVAATPPRRRDEELAARDAELAAVRADLSKILIENDALRLALQNERAARARSEIPRVDVDTAAVLQSQLEAARDPR